MPSPLQLVHTNSFSVLPNMTALNLTTNDYDFVNTQRTELKKIDSISSNSTSSDDEPEPNRFTDLEYIKNQFTALLEREATLQYSLQNANDEIIMRNIKVQLQPIQKQIEQYEPILTSISRKYNENKSLSNDEQLLLQMKQRAMLYRQSTKINPKVAVSYICFGVQRFFTPNPSEKIEIEFKKRLTLIKIAIEANKPDQLIRALDLADANAYKLLDRLLLEAIFYCTLKENTGILKGILIEHIKFLEEIYIHNSLTYKSEPYFFKLALLLANDKAISDLTPLLEPIQQLYNATAKPSDKMLINSTLSNIEALFLKYIKSMLKSQTAPNLRRLAVECSDRLADFPRICSPHIAPSILQAHKNLCSIFNQIIQVNSLLKPAETPCVLALPTNN